MDPHETVYALPPSKRRDTADVVFIMLDFCSGEPRTPTRVMYRANLSYSRLVTVTDSLVEKGLLLKLQGPKPKKHAFLTTARGEKWLALRREAARLEVSPTCQGGAGR